MLKTYEELYPSSITKYLKKHDLHCVRKSKGVFKFIPRVEYSADYRFIVHVCDSYTSEEDPVCINVQVHASSRAKSTSFWANQEEIKFMNALYSFFWGCHIEIKEEEKL